MASDVKVIAFTPHYGAGQALTVTTASQTLSLTDKRAKHLRITNLGTAATQTVFFRLFDSTAGAQAASATTDMLVPFGQSVTVNKADMHDTIAYIGGAAGSAYIMPGEAGLS